MLRILRACTDKTSAAAFGIPLDRKREAISRAEKGLVNETTTIDLIHKALDAYRAEIPDFVRQAAVALTTPQVAAQQVPSVGQPRDLEVFRLIELKEVSSLGIEETVSSVASDCPDEQAFAIKVSDTALEPEIRKDSIVVLSKAQRLSEGLLVGVAIANDGIIVRRYSRGNGNNPTVKLSSSKPDLYPTLNCHSKKDIRWIYPVYSVITRI